MEMLCLSIVFSPFPSLSGCLPLQKGWSRILDRNIGLYYNRQ